MLVIAPEGPLDGPCIETLLDQSFGLDRFRKTSYRYRVGIAPVADLCLVAREGAAIVGAIRYWPIRLGATPALLLGPLAIDPARRGQGIGRALMRASLDRAAAMGYRLVFLVGDPAYYVQHGFEVAPGTIAMPGEDPARLQYVTLAGAELPVQGGLLLCERGPGLLGDPVEVGEQRAAQGGETLVGGHGVVHLAHPGRHGAGHAGPAHDRRQRLDERADGERHGPGRGQAAQGLPHDPEPQALASVLAREARDRLARLRVE
jgi:predicted N-acetyltransferase YhbS